MRYMTRAMDISNIGDDCTGCAACSDACSVDAITMVHDSEGFARPSVDANICISCGKCVKICPAVSFPQTMPISQMFAAFSKDRTLYKESSSGGIFAECARYIIEHGGMAAGASIDSSGKVVHHIIDTPSRVQELQKSKYVQSDTRGIYRKVKSILKSGRCVLFSGCPCQVAGLLAFLGRDYKNLITFDLICHGVPSPGAWDNHVKSITGGVPTQAITFRRKDASARTTYSIDITAPGIKYKGRDGFDDPYMALFITGSANRESCYSCRYASRERVGDITIGDCASSNFYKTFYPWVQLSSVSLNTKKGRAFWSEVEGQFTVTPIDHEREIRLNAQLSHPVQRPGFRDGVYERIKSDGITSVAAEVTPPRTWKVRAKHLVKRLVPNTIRGHLIALKARVHD